DVAAAADVRFLEKGQEAHRLSDRWHRAQRRTTELAARFAGRERLDARTLATSVEIPARAPAGIEDMTARLDALEAERRELSHRVSGMATAQLAQPSAPAVVRLAPLDQSVLWAAAQEAVECALRVENASINVGGMPGETTAPALVDELEAAHSLVDQ